MRQSLITAAALTAAAAFVPTSWGSVTIAVTTAAAPTYAHTLTFDEPGGATGNTANNAFLTDGVSQLMSGDGQSANFVGTLNTNPGFGWLGNGNVFAGPYGAYIIFSAPITSFSCQFWCDAGPASFFGGGAGIIAYNGATDVAEAFENNPAYGGIGASWVNVTTTGGSSFTEVDLYGISDFPISYIDNMSWTSTPAPGAAATFGLGALAMIRRRRA